MKILILGSTGMAGHTIYLYLKQEGHEVYGLDITYNKNFVDYKLDVTKKEELKELILTEKFDAVINSIGILNNFAENNKYLAVYLNSFLPHYLVEITKGLKTKIIHMSTDCVFSGKSGSYTEKSFRDGETFYDRSKALGEIENDKDLTFRNSIIGPDINDKGIGLFNWFMKQEDTIKGYSGAIWTGVTTLTLAKAMNAALKCNLTGLYNLVNNKTISKYEMLNLFNEHMKNGNLKINVDDSVKLNKSLVNTRSDFSFKVGSYKDMIEEMKEWVISHKEHYPHYKI